MNINFWILPIGFLLLFIPRRFLRIGMPEAVRRKRRMKSVADVQSERQPGDFSLRFGEEFSKRRNWIDLFRGIAGSYAIWVVGISMEPNADPVIANVVLGAQITVLALAVLFQTVRLETKFTLYPPVFFITGLLFAIVGWEVALFVIATIWSINIILPSPAVFLAILGILVGAFGFIYGQPPFAVWTATGLTIAPALLAVLSRRRLIQFSKKIKVVSHGG